MTRARSGLPLTPALMLAVAWTALGLHARRYMPFLGDDALISLRYARRLLDGHGLTWTAGERVEGYSNLLWVLGAAGLGALGIDLVTGVRLLGAAGMGAALAAVVYAHPGAPRATAPLLLLVLLFLPLSGAFAVWAIGGMEQPFVAAFLAWAVVLLYRRLEPPGAGLAAMQGPGLLLALCCLTRPDGFLFTGGAALGVLLVGRGRWPAWRAAGALAVLPVVFTLGQLAFRLHYYGEWVPNTALVKLNPSARYALDGWRYLWTGAVSIVPLLVLAGAAAILSWRRRFLRARMALLAGIALPWAGYIVLIGGDIFPAWRHFVPLLVLLVLMAAVGAEWVGRHGRPRLRAGVGAAAGLLLAGFVVLQWQDTANRWALTERWEWDGQVIGTVLKKAFGDRQPLLAVDAAGALPYWSELPALDMLGLNDHYLPRHPPRDGRVIGIGHDLGDGRYVLDRAPDLVVFGIATGSEHGFFRSARELEEDPRFAVAYALVRFEGDDPYPVTAKIWVRRESERIGIRRSPDRIVVPGFLMADGPGSVARLGAAGTLIRPLTGDAPARLARLEVPPGRWRLEARGPRRPPRIRVAPAAPPASPAAPLLDAALPATIAVRGDGPQVLSLVLAPAGDEREELESLVLTREPD